MVSDEDVKVGYVRVNADDEIMINTESLSKYIKANYQNEFMRITFHAING